MTARTAGAGPPAAVRQARRRTDLRVARLLTAAASALLVAILVTGHSRAAFSARTEVPSGEMQAGSVSLSDDDEGRALFPLDALAPGRPVTNCIAVTYDGTIEPIDVSLSAAAQGPLVPHLDLVVERGTGADFGSCEGFRPVEQVWSGPLADLGRRPVGAWTATQGTRVRTFRFTFEMQSSASSGQTAVAEFVWRADA